MTLVSLLHAGVRTFVNSAVNSLSLFVCVCVCLFVVSYEDDSHQRDARHSHPSEDRRDAEIAR